MQDDWKRIDMTGITDSNLYDLDTEHWTPVHNEVVERLCFANLCAHEGRVVAALLRKTFGFHVKGRPKHERKKWDRIALSQFEELTGLDRRRVHEALSRLFKRKIVSVLAGKDRKPKTYAINMNISLWQLSYVARTEPKKGKSVSPVLPKRDKLSCGGRIAPSYAVRTGLSYPDAHTKETPKKNLKESPKESVGPMTIGATGHASKGGQCTVDIPNNEELEAQRRLSSFRNQIAKSDLYFEDELISFKAKTYEELQLIHTGRESKVHA